MNKDSKKDTLKVEDILYEYTYLLRSFHKMKRPFTQDSRYKIGSACRIIRTSISGISGEFKKKYRNIPWHELVERLKQIDSNQREVNDSIIERNIDFLLRHKDNFESCRMFRKPSPRLTIPEKYPTKARNSIRTTKK